MSHSVRSVSEQVKRLDAQFAVTDLYCTDECGKWLFMFARTPPPWFRADYPIISAK